MPVQADLVRYNADTYDRLWRYAHFQAPERTPWWPLVDGLAAGARDRLEIGPGPWPKLPVAGTHVVDLAGPALDLLAEQGALVHHGLLADVGFQDASFDLAALFEVLEHVPEDEALLAELARITRPGAHLVASVPMKMRCWNAFDEFAGHQRRYEPDELSGKLARAGFEIVRFETRQDIGGKLAARVFAAFCRHFPRFSMWVTERVMLPAMLRTRLDWRDASEWDARMATATQCTVVCRRA